MNPSFSNSRKVLAILLTALVLIFGQVFLDTSNTAANGGPSVTITYPENGSFTNQSFNLTATSMSTSYCTYQLDAASSQSMSQTGGINHSTSILGLSMGQHTIIVTCPSDYTEIQNPIIPRAFAQYSNSSSTTFTVVGTGSGTTITGSGSTVTGSGSTSGGGGFLGHYACSNNMCVLVSGFGSNLCSSNADCGSATNGNQNGNTNSAGGQGNGGNTNNNKQCSKDPGVTEQQIATVLQYFTDVPSTHWGVGYITRAFLESYMRGDQDTHTFRPDANTTRAEYAKVLSSVFQEPLPLVTSDPFPDVKKTYWYAPYALILKNHGLGAAADGKFHPHVAIKRGEAMVEIITMAGIDVSGESIADLPFTDVSADASYAKAIAWAYHHCIISGRTSTLFQPDDNITRAEVAKISVLIHNFLGV